MKYKNLGGEPNPNAIYSGEKTMGVNYAFGLFCHPTLRSKNKNEINVEMGRSCTSNK
jgi:hypothetical protein